MRFFAGLILGVLIAAFASASAQPAAVPVVYFSTYRRTATTFPTMFVWIGPDATVPSCLSSQQAIANAPAGVGSLAWGYTPVTLCYPVTGWTTP